MATAAKIITVLLEKNVYYTPPTDKEKLLYDFYASEFFNHLRMMQHDLGPGDGPNTQRMGLDSTTEASFLEARKTLLGVLKEEMSRSVFFAVSAELRHAFANNSRDRFDKVLNKAELAWLAEYYASYQAKTNDHLDLVPKNPRHAQIYTREKRGYADSYSSIKLAMVKTNFSAAQVMVTAQKMFLQLNWPASYGGKPWANICSGWLRLYNARSENELTVAIDHIYDLQHNTDTVFNKLKSYYRNNSYEWIKNALNFKRDVKDPNFLLDKTSSQMKKMCLEIGKAAGWRTHSQTADAARPKPVKSISLFPPKPATSSGVGKSFSTKGMGVGVSFAMDVLNKFAALESWDTIAETGVWMFNGSHGWGPKLHLNRLDGTITIVSGDVPQALKVMGTGEVHEAIREWVLAYLGSFCQRSGKTPPTFTAGDKTWSVQVDFGGNKLEVFAGDARESFFTFKQTPEAVKYLLQKTKAPAPPKSTSWPPQLTEALNKLYSKCVHIKAPGSKEWTFRPKAWASSQNKKWLRVYSESGKRDGPYKIQCIGPSGEKGDVLFDKYDIHNVDKAIMWLYSGASSEDVDALLVKLNDVLKQVPSKSGEWKFVTKKLNPDGLSPQLIVTTDNIQVWNEDRTGNIGTFKLSDVEKALAAFRECEKTFQGKGAQDSDVDHNKEQALEYYSMHLQHADEDDSKVVYRLMGGPEIPNITVDSGGISLTYQDGGVHKMAYSFTGYFSAFKHMVKLYLDAHPELKASKLPATKSTNETEIWTAGKGEWKLFIDYSNDRITVYKNEVEKSHHYSLGRAPMAVTKLLEQNKANVDPKQLNGLKQEENDLAAKEAFDFFTEYLERLETTENATETYILRDGPENLTLTVKQDFDHKHYLLLAVGDNVESFPIASFEDAFDKMIFHYLEGSGLKIEQDPEDPAEYRCYDPSSDKVWMRIETYKEPHFVITNQETVFQKFPLHQAVNAVSMLKTQVKSDAPVSSAGDDESKTQAIEYCQEYGGLLKPLTASGNKYSFEQDAAAPKLWIKDNSIHVGFSGSYVEYDFLEVDQAVEDLKRCTRKWKNSYSKQSAVEFFSNAPGIVPLSADSFIAGICKDSTKQPCPFIAVTGENIIIFQGKSATKFSHSQAAKAAKTLLSMSKKWKGI